ncbi:TPA: translesion error-prone DNA polymerase V subunit UmuC [Providencia stuartii]|uniref:translesion error-prone DNA polymerase V subunit UmuC n=1 Tax=Providencia stuartii TaxID=588 RepID=UPI00113FF7ED|nr:MULTISPECIES: translesion error-prone DNA polymerase V subunit UmuC [Providencia]MBN5562682.1 translesion error-prone DNA polymerase V subunit UmuC [Providencia stuartii]MBN5602619.1 translesion error-prone DNA polymerase V subunit UmuC [Providencia stuartii]MBN5606626.1 translesion error-prone DNA polymerase V subunit UmuC [Providencia stuartii]MCL8325753.1 translesion error-prone DNA polymerase V subunit UmuC [Providencia thailandensis]MDF4174732.1 translesion error-prone DNA polymerase V
MPVFALVDCNNFYASCEKLFRPDLKDTPVVVLSNNDGCVVARSREAKLLGIKMGVPVFQIKAEMQRHGILAFSPNYALYADLSSRVMRTLEEMAPRVEVYSIDEAFLDLTSIESAISLGEFGQQVRERIGHWIGITVCVGIAPTKTLAKLANHAAKKYPATQGVVDLTNPDRQRRLLALVPIDDVWGVGRRLSKRLNALGITTALDLANASPRAIRDQFSVVLERTVRELNGESCIELEELPPTKKQIVCSRSFGEKVTQFELLREAVCEYATRATEKLRKEQQQAKVMTVFIRTSPFKDNEPQYSNSASGELLIPSCDTRDFIELANHLLKRIWKDGFRYAKAGVMLSDFYDPGMFQPGLFDDVSTRSNSQQLMSVLDTINQSGAGKVFFAGQGTKKDWSMKREHLSPAYTTRWDQLPRVK